VDRGRSPPAGPRRAMTVGRSARGNQPRDQCGLLSLAKPRNWQWGIPPHGRRQVSTNGSEPRHDTYGRTQTHRPKIAGGQSWQAPSTAVNPGSPPAAAGPSHLHPSVEAGWAGVGTSIAASFEPDRSADLAKLIAPRWRAIATKRTLVEAEL
jgi:hypothetical protein